MSVENVMTQSSDELSIVTETPVVLPTFCSQTVPSDAIAALAGATDPSTGIIDPVSASRKTVSEPSHNFSVLFTTS